MPEVKGIGGGAAGNAQAPGIHDRDPQKIADAARQFEALLIGQLLKASRASSGSGWMGTGDDQAGAQAIDLAEEQLAQALARQGGLGLADLVVAGLRQKADAAGANSGHAAAPFVNGPASLTPAAGSGSASRGAAGGGGSSTGNFGSGNFGSSARNPSLASGNSLSSGGSVGNPAAAGKSSSGNQTQPAEIPAGPIPSRGASQKLQP